MAGINLHDMPNAMKGITDVDEGFLEDSMKIYMSQMLTEKKDVNENLPGTFQFDSIIKKYNFKEHCVKQRADKYNLSTVTSQSFSKDVNEDDRPLAKTMERMNEYFGTCYDIPVKNITEVLGDTRCDTSEKSLKFHVLCLVLETFPIKEIWIKSKKMWITTGMAVITDTSSDTTIKLMFWSEQCSHLFSLLPGSVILASKVVAGSYYKDTVLKLARDSVLFNFGLAKDLSNELETIDCTMMNQMHLKIKQLCRETVKKYPSVANKARIIHKNSNVSLVQDFDDLTPGIIVHVRAKISTMQHNYVGLRRGSHKVTLSTSFSPATCRLHLHGSAQSWIKKIIMYRQHVWEFNNLACCMSSESVTELHTTVLSSAECLFHEDDRALCSKISKFPIVVNSHKKLTSMLQKEHSSALLRSVRTDKFKFCNAFDLHHITITTPVGSITKMISSYLEKSWEQNSDYIALMANCFFANEPNKSFRVKFTSFDKVRILCIYQMLL